MRITTNKGTPGAAPMFTGPAGRQNGPRYARGAFLRGFLGMGVVAALIIVLLQVDGARRISAAVSAAPVPGGNAFVVAELFTSEGCSSCPPADDLLSRIVRQQPIAGVTVLGLSENVDYWNSLGWIDPFSSAGFTKRQSDYSARVFHANDVYTPQMIIDGSLQEVGSDRAAVYRAIAQAAKAPKATLNVTAALDSAAPSQLQVEVQIPHPASLDAAAGVILAVTENNLTSDVARGENKGRRLEHDAVVRSFEKIGDLAPPAGDWSKTVSIAVSPDWNTANLKVIGFLQDQRSWRIVGAGWSEVRSPASR